MSDDELLDSMAGEIRGVVSFYEKDIKSKAFEAGEAAYGRAGKHRNLIARSAAKRGVQGKDLNRLMTRVFRSNKDIGS